MEMAAPQSSQSIKHIGQDNVFLPAHTNGYSFCLGNSSRELVTINVKQVRSDLLEQENGIHRVTVIILTYETTNEI